MDYLPDNVRKMINNLDEEMKILKERLQFEEKRFNKTLNENIKKDPTSNPKFEDLSNDYIELSENGIFEIIESIQKVYKFEDQEMYQFFVKFLLVKGFDHLSSISKDNLSMEHLQNLSGDFRKLLNQNFKDLFKKDITKIDFDLKRFVKLILEIENSTPPVTFINPSQPKKVKFNSIEHKLDSGTIKLSKVICPGISSNNYVLAKAKVEVDQKFLSEDNETGSNK
jgi:hypothetical protein